MSLERAIKLREAGDVEGIKQLVREHPQDGRIAYQCAWTHDKLGLEAEAVPFYQRALELGLPPEELRGAYLGLGSTLRCLDRPHDSLEVLDNGLQEFPEDSALKAFRALTLYSLDRAGEAVSTLLKLLLETSQDPGIQAYNRALSYYADHLDPDEETLTTP